MLCKMFPWIATRKTGKFLVLITAEQLNQVMQHHWNKTGLMHPLKDEMQYHFGPICLPGQYIIDFTAEQLYQIMQDPWNKTTLMHLLKGDTLYHSMAIYLL